MLTAGCICRTGSRLPSTSFLFWNINRKPLAAVVAELANEHRAHVVVLAESNASPSALLGALNPVGRSDFHFPAGSNKYLTIFTRFPRECLQPVYETGRISIRRLSLPGRSEILIAAVHLASKLHWTSESQAFECTQIARKIADEEDRVGHQRTVVFGDFNMNPFEAGLVSCAGFNAVMSRRIAARIPRTSMDGTIGSSTIRCGDISEIRKAIRRVLTSTTTAST
jgi:hypothetical protein